MCLIVEWKNICEVLGGYNAQQCFTSQHLKTSICHQHHCENCNTCTLFTSS